MKFRPINNHLLVEPIIVENENTSLATFNEFVIENPETLLYKVLDSPVEAKHWVGKTILVERVSPHTIDENTFYTCLTNHVVGVYDKDS